MPLPRCAPALVPALGVLLALAPAPYARTAHAAGPGTRAPAVRVVADSLARRAERYVRLGRPREAEAPAREALRLATSASDTSLILRSLRWLAVSVGNQGRSAEMAATWERALPIATASGDFGAQGFARLGIGYHVLAGERAAVALREFESARRLFLRAGDPV